MSRLPRMAIAEPSDWQRQRLARWLCERNDDRVLRKAYRQTRRSNGAVVADQRRVAALVAPATEDLAPARGQIRLLHPELQASDIGPVYIAILREQTRGAFLIAPYGRYAEPAFEGELRTRRDLPALRVLCLWNSRVLSPVILNRSWFVTQMDAAELADGLAVCAQIGGGEALPTELRERVGPPLRHPLDPRWEYKDEEAARMAVVADRAETLRTAREGETVLPWNGHYDVQSDLLKAAEERDEYDAGPKK